MGIERGKLYVRMDSQGRKKIIKLDGLKLDEENYKSLKDIAQDRQIWRINLLDVTNR